VRLPKLILVLALTGVTALLPTRSAPTDAPGMIKHFHVRVPMRDGVNLYANIFRQNVTGKVPAILIRTPYNKGADLAPQYEPLVQRGYALVLQDVRGRYESEGVFRPLTQEPQDGDDTLNWIARQDWSDGNIGMMGGSYLGIVQWKVALLNNPHLKAISPVVSGYDDYRDRFYSTGGAMKLGNRLGWMRDNLRAPGYHPPDFKLFVLHLPLRTSDRFTTGQTVEMFQKAMDHPDYDSFWQSISTRKQIQQIKVPVLSFGGWYDNFVQSDLEAHSALQRTSSVNHIVIGPWPHNMSIKFTGVDYGPGSAQAVRSMQLEWFDQWLKRKDTPIVSSAPVKIFVMGANRWREEREWPLARAKATRLYLHGTGHANTGEGDGVLAMRPPHKEQPDRFVFNPRDPVPTEGGAVCCNPKVFPWGPYDQRPVERRRDVLVYSSQPLVKDLEVTGPIQVVLFASTSAPDTDFTAKLVDVFPDGIARNLTDGILRMRYRESLEKPVKNTPGETYKLAIDAGVTSNVFLKGHRIRVEISSSNFPRFDRNPNTGRRIADETELRTANQTIYHDRAHASYVLLPIVP
jgi:putative CocE/NonD family hydrolase